MGFLVTSTQAAALYDPDVNVLDATYGVGTGSFELGTLVNNGSGFMRLSAGSTELNGWTIGGNGVDWLTGPDHTATDGMRSLDMAAQTGGWIQTVIPTIAGNKFTVEFDAYAGQWANAGILRFGSYAPEFFMPSTVAQASSATFEHFIFTFIAESDSAILRFEAGRSDGFGPVIDNVVVKDPPANGEHSVPEPASFGLASLLALSFGAAFLRRKQAR
jgi:hypothetical protein